MPGVCVRARGGQDGCDMAEAPLRVVIQNFKPYQYMSVNLYGEEDEPIYHHIYKYLDLFLPHNSMLDLDSDMLQYRVFLNESSPLPGWLNYIASKRKLYGTPRQLDEGRYNFSVLVNDNQFLIRRHIALVVYNKPPEYIGTFVSNTTLDYGEELYLSFRT